MSLAMLGNIPVHAGQHLLEDITATQHDANQDVGYIHYFVLEKKKNLVSHSISRIKWPMTIVARCYSFHL